MRMSRLGITIAISSAWLLAALTYRSAAGAAQTEKPAREKAGATCCAEASKTAGCQGAKRCCSGAKGKCCEEKDCDEKEQKGACCTKSAACAAESPRSCGAVRQPRESKTPARTASQSKKQPEATSLKARKDPAEQWAKAVARLKKIGYTDEDISFLPRGAVLASAGANNVVLYAKLKPGDVVVDLGCGGGIDCLLAGRILGNSGKVIGVDMSAKARATARANLQEAGLKNVEFRQGRLEKLPLPDASINVAISNCVGIVMRGDAAVLSEAARVLKPGGRLVTTGRLSDEYRARLKAAGFTVIEQPAKGMIVARKPK